MLPAGLLNNEDAGAAVDAGAELAGVLPPPRLENNDGPEVAVVVVPAPAVVIEAEEVAVVEAGAFPPSLGKPNPPEAKPPEAFDPVVAEANMLLGASVVEAAGWTPPELKGFAELLAGCDGAPRPKDGGLFAGVADGVVLPRLPNKEDFGVACVPCAPDCGAPENRPPFDEGADCWVEVVLFAPAEASLLPSPPKMLEPPGVLPSAFVVPEAGAAEPNMLGVEDVDGAGGFAPKREEVPDELVWEGWLPNRLLPGGGPAGVVEGKAKVLFGAGVCAGVDDPVLMLEVFSTV